MTTPTYWGRCDTCGSPMEEVGRIAVYSAPLGTLRFRFCSGECKERFQNREVHKEYEDGDLS